MKKCIFFAVALFCVFTMTSCIEDDCGCSVDCSCGGDCGETCVCDGNDEPIIDDGTGEIPSREELVGTWQSNEYRGWEPKLEQNVVIARELVLNDDGTYTNRYRGRLTQKKDGSTLSTTEMGNWEEEYGTWSYNVGSDAAEITYNPISDKRVNYETTELEIYNLSRYSEKSLIKTSGEYKGMWITLDTYLKRSGNKGDLRYAMSKK